MGLFIDFGRGRACASDNENNKATTVKRTRTGDSVGVAYIIDTTTKQLNTSHRESLDKQLVG